MNNVSQTSRYTGASRKLSKLLQVLSDDKNEMEGNSGTGSSIAQSQEPWLEDFHGYLNLTDQLGKLTIVQW